MKLKIFLLAILLAFSFADGYAKEKKEKKEKKPKIDDRVERLEALTEYLLTRNTLTSNNGASSSADCGLTVDFDLLNGFIATGIARDTTPPSVPGPISGTLVYLNDDGCDLGQFATAASPNEVIAMSRGGCYFVDKAQHAADAGYAAAIIYNIGDPSNFEGQLLVQMGGPEGSSYALPTVAMNAKDGLDLPFLQGLPVTINGPAEFCTSNE